MSTPTPDPTIFPFLLLPLELRLQIYTLAFRSRDPAFTYVPTQQCVHNHLTARSFFAYTPVASYPPDSQIWIQDLTYDSCSHRTRIQQKGFLAMRLACRQVYEETYDFVKLPEIVLSTHGFVADGEKIGVVRGLVEMEGKEGDGMGLGLGIRTHVREFDSEFRVSCGGDHGFGNGGESESERDKFGFGFGTRGRVWTKWWGVLMGLLWREYEDGEERNERICRGDFTETGLLPLTELLALFPRLESAKITVVTGCGLKFDAESAQGDEGLQELRKRGVNIEIQCRE